MSTQLLILPGYALTLREWARDVSAELEPLFGTVHLLEYLHWNDPTREFSFDQELDRIRQLDLPGDDLYLFAKSIGCLLGLSAADGELFSPQAAVLVGFPLQAARAQGFPVEDRLAHLDRVLFIQNQDDPVAGAEEVRTLLRPGAQHKLVVLPGDSHHYPDLMRLRGEIEGYLAEVDAGR